MFTNTNEFKSISNILHSFLDHFCDWLCTSHMIHLEPWRVYSNGFCINDAASCDTWKFKLVLSNSWWKELSNGIRFAYIPILPGLALKVHCNKFWQHWLVATHLGRAFPFPESSSDDRIIVSSSWINPASNYENDTTTNEINLELSWHVNFATNMNAL